MLRICKIFFDKVLVEPGYLFNQTNFMLGRGQILTGSGGNSCDINSELITRDEFEGWVEHEWVIKIVLGFVTDE